jgi:hypothetical protein
VPEAGINQEAIGTFQIAVLIQEEWDFCPLEAFHIVPHEPANRVKVFHTVSRSLVHAIPMQTNRPQAVHIF